MLFLLERTSIGNPCGKKSEQRRAKMQQSTRTQNIPLRGRPSVSLDPNSTPRLAAGCRLGENNNQRVLLMPERALRLNGPSLEIVQRCDGQHTVQQIVADLQKLYSKAEPEKVEQDILGYLKLLHDQRALDFESSAPL